MKVAVVIPARDAAHLLPGCTQAVDAQDRPPDETWIAVAPSTDDTMAIARRLASERPSVHVVDNAAGDRASGLNLAIAATDADLLAFVDAQATLAPDYLSAAMHALAETDAAVVGGPMRPVGTTAIGRAMAAALQSPFGVGDSQFHFAGRAREVASVYLGVYRSSVFRTVGVYNTALLRTEDDDLNARVREAGMRIWLDPAVRSTYRCRDTVGGIWRQYFGYGYWKVALTIVRPSALGLRHFVPMLFLDALAIGLILGLLGWWWLLVVVVGAWLVLAVAAGMAAPADGLVARLLFPVVAFTMHVGYGMGTLAGLVRLPSLRRPVRAGAVSAELERQS